MGWGDGVDKRGAHSQSSGEQSPRDNSFTGEGKGKLEKGKKTVGACEAQGSVTRPESLQHECSNVKWCVKCS